MNKICQRCGQQEEYKDRWEQPRMTSELVEHQQLSLMSDWSPSSRDGAFKLQRSAILCNPCVAKIVEILDIAMSRIKPDA